MSGFYGLSNGMGIWSMPAQTPITPTPSAWELYKAAWLALNPEALWIADEGVIEVGGRTSSWQDITSHGHDVTQSIAGSKPLLVSTGVAPHITFEHSRNDYLENPTAITLGTSPYTFVAVYRWRSLITAEGDGWQMLFTNGTDVVDAFEFFQQLAPAPAPEDFVVHCPVSTSRTDPFPDTNLKSVISRNDGVNLYTRLSGVDGAPAVLASQLTPTGGITIAQINGGGGAMGGGDVDIYAIAVFKRYLSNIDTNIVSALITQHYSI